MQNDGFLMTRLTFCQYSRILSSRRYGHDLVLHFLRQDCYLQKGFNLKKKYINAMALTFCRLVMLINMFLKFHEDILSI